MPKSPWARRGVKTRYLDTESVVGGLIPDSPELGKPLDMVTGIDKVVKVDVFIPGLPSERPDTIFFALTELLAGACLFSRPNISNTTRGDNYG